MRVKRESTEYRGLPTPPEETIIDYSGLRKVEDSKPDIFEGSNQPMNGLPVYQSTMLPNPMLGDDFGHQTGPQLSAPGTSIHIMGLSKNLPQDK